MIQRTDGKARLVLCLIVACGAALLSIPFFLTPPAQLELVLRDRVFGTDLAARHASVIHDASGRAFRALVQKVGKDYVAHVGRIDSGSSALTVQMDGFRNAAARITAAPLQQVRAAVELAPAFGRLEITPVNALIANQPVAAVVREGTRPLVNEPRQLITVDLPPGKHRLSASADGFCAAEHEFDIREGKVTTARFPLSPDLTPDEIARFVLHWTREPRDLDAHLRKVGTSGNRNPGHAFWAHRSATAGNTTVAHLDVDEVWPQGYETVTVNNAAEGDFEYYVHRYAGYGTIPDAAPLVQVYTRGCRTKTFTPPPGCAQNVWAVVNLRNGPEGVQLSEQQRCEDGGMLSFGGKAPRTRP